MAAHSIEVGELVEGQEFAFIEDLDFDFVEGKKIAGFDLVNIDSVLVRSIKEYGNGYVKVKARSTHTKSKDTYLFSTTKKVLVFE